jgi:hypothetical protein
MRRLFLLPTTICTLTPPAAIRPPPPQAFAPLSRKEADKYDDFFSFTRRCFHLYRPPPIDLLMRAAPRGGFAPEKKP